MTRLQIITMVAASALVSAITTSLITIQWHDHHNPAHQNHEPDSHDFHTWLHTNLDLTEAQSKALLPIEESFTAEQKRLRVEIASAADDLAHRISHQGSDQGSDQGQDDAAVTNALERLDHAQAALHRLSLSHFFQMKKELTPEQTKQILRWTHDSIVGDHSH